MTQISLKQIIKPLKREGHEKKIGRYWASEVSSIIKGYITPSNYFTPKEIDDKGALNIFYGVALENQLTAQMKAHGVEISTQESIEIPIEDFILVVKPDFINEICIESKCPERPLTEIPERYKYQLECEFRATKKPTYLLSFQRPEFLLLKYEPCGKRWQQIQEELSKFHSKLVKKYGKL